MTSNKFSARHFSGFLASLSCLCCLWAGTVNAQVVNNKFRQADSFRQLDESLPTPTETRLASGAPGPKYWQQRADYVIDVEIDDETQRLIGREQITIVTSPRTS